MTGTSLDGLSEEVLVKVLSYADRDSQLNTSLACSRLRSVAPAALQSINLKRVRPATTDSLQLYLNQHGRHVTSMQLGGTYDSTWLALSQLLGPCTQLQCLRLDQMRLQLLPGPDPAAAMLQGLSSCLTQLDLMSCTIAEGLTVLPAVLEQLRGLRQLSLGRLSEPVPAVAPGKELAAADDMWLPDRLLTGSSSLTSLSLSGCITEGSLEGIRSMPQLQAITLKYDDERSAMEVAVVGPQLTHLGGCLTALALRFTVYDESLDPLGSCSIAEHLPVLTALQHLELLHQGVLDPPAVLAGLTRIQHLDLRGTQLQDGAAGTAVLLQYLAKLTQLTHLGLTSTLQEPVTGNPSAYTALTASSSLVHLDLSECRLKDGAWAHILPARIMGAATPPHCPSLTYLGVLDSSPQFQPYDLQRLVYDCPALRELHLGETLASYTEEPLSAGELHPITELVQLTSLFIWCEEGDAVAPWAQVLAPLPCLQRLLITGGMSDVGVLSLTALKHLTLLEAPPAIELGPGMILLENQADAGKPPDVWIQLLQTIAPGSTLAARVASQALQSMSQVADLQQQLQAQEARLLAQEERLAAQAAFLSSQAAQLSQLASRFGA